MARLSTATSEGVLLEHELADAGSRLAAGIVDVLVLAMLAFALVMGTAAIASIDPSGAGQFLFGWILGGIVLMVVGYHVVFHRFADGRTPGKMLLAIRVLGVDGQPPSLVALFVRAFVWPIDAFLFLPAPVGLYVIALSPRRQRLGDLAAGTVVVHDAPRRSDEPLRAQRWSDLTERKIALTPAALAHLEAPDVELLREILARDSLSTTQRLDLVRRAAQHYSERLGLGPFADPRDVVRELYVFAREMRAAEGGASQRPRAVPPIA